MAQSNYVSEYGPIKRMPRLNAPTERLLGRLSNSNYDLSVSKHLQVRAPSLFVLTGLHLTKVKSLSDFLLYYGGSFQLHKHFKKFVYLNENPLSPGGSAQVFCSFYFIYMKIGLCTVPNPPSVTCCRRNSRRRRVTNRSCHPPPPGREGAGWNFFSLAVMSWGDSFGLCTCQKAQMSHCSIVT